MYKTMNQGGGMIGPQVPPSMDQPLQFNTNKGKPPMPVMLENSGGDRMKDSVVSSTMATDSGSGSNMMMSGNMMGNQGNMMGNQGNMMGNQGNMMGNQGYYGNMGYSGGNMGNMMSGQMMGDPNMMMNQMMYNQFGNWGPMGQMAQGGPGMGPMGGMGGPDMALMAKEIIHLKSSVLYPPPPGAPPPTTRERPPGCRTIFVGGLPENVEENMIVEIFEHFGNICSLRKGKKNFAHIRYELEESVDRAIFISGYRMKLEDKDDKPNTGRLHVDYAMARDDQYEFECKQRMLMREMRHYQMVEEEKLRPPSPPPVAHYSDHEAQIVMEKLKNDDEFVKTSSLLMTWLDRGDLTRRNVNAFYSMLQCMNSHVRRLLNEKQQQEEELARTKEKFKQIFQGILHQFDQIERVFSTALKQRNWDHFSKPQRKNLELWNKQTQEIKQRQQEEFLNERVEDEMEMSDNEDTEVTTTKKRKTEEQGFNASNMIAQFDAGELHSLKDDNDSLRCQLEAYKNEIDMIKQENVNSVEGKEKEMKMLRQALQGMQQQLIQAKQQANEIEKASDLKLKVLERKIRERSKSEGEKEKEKDGEEKEEDGEKTEKTDETKSSDEGEKDTEIEIPGLTMTKDLSGLDTVSSTGLSVTEKEAKLIGLVSCFLHVHPNGASVDYIWSYLSQIGIHTRTSELEDLLDKLPMLFKRELSGVGASIERKWQFIGYKSSSPLSFFM